MASYPAAKTTATGSHESSAQFARQISELVKDLIAPRMSIYWTDMLLTFAIGQIGLWYYTMSPLWSAPFFLGFFAAGFAFYRGIIFSHELAHFRAGAGGSFRFAWNALFGVPFMFPMFLYDDHKIHHVNHSYGTVNDAEYAAFGRGSLFEIVTYILRIFLVPIFAVLRFLVLAPIGWCSKSFRLWLWQLSSPIVALNLSYRRELPRDAKESRTWIFQEVCCFLYACGFLSLIYLGVWHWTILLQMYCLFVFVSGMNYIRTLGAHRYLSEGNPSSYLEQLLDSYTIVGFPYLSELWAPLGTRYHALHHLVPSMPYHNLHRAHLRLLRELPADSPYRTTLRPNLWQAIGEVAAHARGARLQSA
jgi:fatty acid desaturase